LNTLSDSDLQCLISVARDAGAEIMEVYGTEFSVEKKADRSPVTEADMRAHRLIVARLRERFPEVPVLSEESAHDFPYETRKPWGTFWLVDPLDGTKEFIKRNGQFTVNIALIQAGRPVAGIVYAPAKDLLYFAANGAAARQEGEAEPVTLDTTPREPEGKLTIAGSLSHPTPEMDAFIEMQKRVFDEVEFLPMGSSLKLCLVAEGTADIYPRLGPTMEWDTAAAHAVVNAAGRKVYRYGSEEELLYNKPDLHNPWFVVR
jgi:3'(2'), 5'-bisphosphate nucleotidase